MKVIVVGHELPCGYHKPRFQVFRVSLAVMRSQLAAGDRDGGIVLAISGTTTHRSWFLTCEGVDGRTGERPPLPDEGERL